MAPGGQEQSPWKRGPSAACHAGKGAVLCSSQAAGGAVISSPLLGVMEGDSGEHLELCRPGDGSSSFLPDSLIQPSLHAHFKVACTHVVMAGTYLTLGAGSVYRQNRVL